MFLIVLTCVDSYHHQYIVLSNEMWNIRSMFMYRDSQGGDKTSKQLNTFVITKNPSK